MGRIQIIQNLGIHRPRPQPTLRISDDSLMNGRLQKQLARDLPSHTHNFRKSYTHRSSHGGLKYED